MFNFNEHWELKGRHATLSPSGYHWLNYDTDKMRNVYLNNLRKERGTRMHELASEMIELEIRPKSLKQAFNMFVNDCLDDGMASEVPLKYSDNCFGTADGIQYYPDKKLLRIYDLKTGTSKPSFNQLRIYAALFCHEYGPIYGFKPKDLTYELRLYQGRGAMVDEDVSGGMIQDILNQIKMLDDEINKIKQEV